MKNAGNMYTVSRTEIQDLGSWEVSGDIIFITCASQFKNDPASHASH
jgi:hypothetical protein